MGLKWLISGNKNTTNVKNKMRKRKRTTRILEAALAASTVSTKEENLVDMVELAVSITLAEKESTRDAEDAIRYGSQMMRL